MPLFTRATLQLTPSKSSPLLRGILFFFLTIPLVILAAEIIARSPLGDRLPAPSVEADSFLFDAKVYQLEQQVRRDGKIDCIFIGSSVTNSGIDPATIERVYKERTGETIHCFNIGYPAMTVENAAAFADALIAKFSPRVIFYTFIPRDLTDVKFTVDFLEQSPWLKPADAQTSLHDWLVDHSYAYRYYLTWRYLLVNANRTKRLDEIKNLTSKGFQPAIGIRAPYPAAINMTPEYLAQVWTEPRTAQMLEQLLARQTDGTRLILVEGALYNDSQSPVLWEAYERDYIAPLEKLLSEHNIPYWRSTDITARIPKQNWYDWFHFNQAGAETFSEWLGNMLAQRRELFQ